MLKPPLYKASAVIWATETKHSRDVTAAAPLEEASVDENVTSRSVLSLTSWSSGGGLLVSRWSVCCRVSWPCCCCSPSLEPIMRRTKFPPCRAWRSDPTTASGRDTFGVDPASFSTTGKSDVWLFSPNVSRRCCVGASCWDFLLARERAQQNFTSFVYRSHRRSLAQMLLPNIIYYFYIHIIIWCFYTIMTFFIYFFIVLLFYLFLFFYYWHSWVDSKARNWKCISLLCTIWQ